MFGRKAKLIENLQSQLDAQILLRSTGEDTIRDNKITLDKWAAAYKDLSTQRDAQNDLIKELQAELEVTKKDYITTVEHLNSLQQENDQLWQSHSQVFDRLESLISRLETLEISSPKPRAKKSSKRKR